MIIIISFVMIPKSGTIVNMLDINKENNDSLKYVLKGKILYLLRHPLKYPRLQNSNIKKAFNKVPIDNAGGS